MHLLNQGTLGIGILFLLAGLVIVKRLATGSILDKPEGALPVKLGNLFNLFFLLVVNPLAAILLMTHRLTAIGLTRPAVATIRLSQALEIVGLAAYLAGFFLMAWALIALGRGYQSGGSAPRVKDELVADGPYRLVRHPMYAAALAISLGLACLTRSPLFLAVFFIYLALILFLIALEEKGLRKAYGESYAAYRQNVKRLVPFLY
ncbi:MAG TPA: isoprenylcysteine carboxylmethyltransferase family protein [Acidobacteriota bacterium]